MGDAVQLLWRRAAQILNEGEQLLSRLLCDVVVGVTAREVGLQLVEFVGEFLWQVVVGLRDGLQIAQLLALFFGEFGVLAQHLHPTEGLGKHRRHGVRLEEAEQGQQDGTNAHGGAHRIVLSSKEGGQPGSRFFLAVLFDHLHTAHGVDDGVWRREGADVFEVGDAVGILVQKPQLGFAAPLFRDLGAALCRGAVVLRVEHPVTVVVVEAPVTVLVEV